MLISILILPVLSLFRAGAGQQFRDELASFEESFYQTMEEENLEQEYQAALESVSMEEGIMLETREQIEEAAGQYLQDAGEAYLVTGVDVQEGILEFWLTQGEMDQTSQIRVDPIQIPEITGGNRTMDETDATDASEEAEETQRLTEMLAYAFHLRDDQIKVYLNGDS